VSLLVIRIAHLTATRNLSKCSWDAWQHRCCHLGNQCTNNVQL